MKTVGYESVAHTKTIPRLISISGSLFFKTLNSFFFHPDAPKFVTLAA
jgi:hypothetical protein